MAQNKYQKSSEGFLAVTMRSRGMPSALEYPQHHVRRDLTRHQHNLARPRDRLLVAEAKGRKIHLAREEDPISAFRCGLGAAVRAPCDVPVLVAQDALAPHFQVRVHVGVKAGVFRRGPNAYNAPDTDGKGPTYRQDLAADALRLAARLPFSAKSGEPHAPCRDTFSDPVQRSGLGSLNGAAFHPRDQSRAVLELLWNLSLICARLQLVSRSRFPCLEL
jgi:hypothetical protein